MRLANKDTYFNKFFYSTWIIQQTQTGVPQLYSEIIQQIWTGIPNLCFYPNLQDVPGIPSLVDTTIFPAIQLEPKKIYRRIFFFFWKPLLGLFFQVKNQSSPTVLAKLESCICSNCCPIKKINKNIQPGPSFQVFTFLHKWIFPLWCRTEQFDILLLLGLEIHSLHYGLEEKKKLEEKICVFFGQQRQQISPSLVRKYN